MKSISILTCILCVWLVSIGSAQQPTASSPNNNSAMVPPLVSFSGVLTDLNGKPMTGVVGVTFALYKDQQGGAPLWLETQNVYSDKTGHYTVLLGSTTSTGLPSDLFAAGEARWLGVQVQGQAEQRISLSSVPYALKAADAQTIGGLPPSAFVLAVPASSSPASPTNAAPTPLQSTAQPMVTGTTPVTTAGGTINTIPLFSSASDIENSLLTQTGTTAININGKLNLAPTGTATATKGYSSQSNNYTASVFNSATGKAVNEKFLFQTVPVGNNTANPSGSLHLLFGSGSGAPVETGVKVAANGIITFAAGQTFPGAGSGTVKSVGLTAPSTEFLVTGSPVTGSGTLGLGWLVAPDFNNTPNAIVKRDSSGNFSAGTINAANSFNLAGNAFAFGSAANSNAFLGFAGNTTTTGGFNTGIGQNALAVNVGGMRNTATGMEALYANTDGIDNTATGTSALIANTTGNDNTASGWLSLNFNTTGGFNTAMGSSALAANTTGSYDTALGSYADVGSANLTNATAIGARAQVTQSNSLVLGSIAGVNDATANTNVGIGTTAPQYTLDVNGTGHFAGPVTFAPGQTFPGSGTISSVTAGTGLTGGGTSGTVELALDTSKVPLLDAMNTFIGDQFVTGSQTVSGNLSASGLVTGTAFNIGSNLFAYGSYANRNAFLGFAGNTTTTGSDNTAGGYLALWSNTTGFRNTASGGQALYSNTAGVANTASGFGALWSNTTGNYNTATGDLTLFSNTTGGYNTADGYYALEVNTEGFFNTASGAYALKSNASGNSNTANGDYVLASNTTGSANTASGSQALYSNTTGNNNSANGNSALYSNTTGVANTASGLGALYFNTTGSENIALGYYAGPDWNHPDLTNATAIGAKAQVTQSNSLVLGSINGVNGATASTKVGIGTTAPQYTLDVNGDSRFTQPITFAAGQTFPGAGTVTSVGSGAGLTGGPISGSGTLSIATGGVTNAMLASPSLTVAAGTDLTGGGVVPLGGTTTLNLDTTKVPQLAAANTFTGNQTVNGNLSATGVVTGSSYQIGSNLFAFGNYGNQNAFLGFAGNTTITGLGANTGVGYKALFSETTGYRNTAAGYLALSANTEGLDNTAIGSGALQQNTIGIYNTAVGNAALFGNTTGGHNTATGNGALGYNTTANDNTADGAFALTSNTTGTNNTASGSDALYSNTGGYNNTASGYQALYKNTTGVLNTAVGGYALTANATGIDNTACGHSALSTNTTGSNNTALGFGADVGSGNLNYATAVGTGAVVSQSNSLVLGGTGPYAVKVGIGTATPAYTLDVIGTGRFTGNLTKGGGSFKIDHPLDPANKYLSHSFVESPDMMNIYNGNVVTDKHGLATIELPDWFEALNRDFRYQLTVIGQFAQAIVVQKVKNNHFTLKTNKPGVEVSWQVTGIRQDAYANAHRIPTEEEKPPQEKGFYLHPELFGAGPEKAVSTRPGTVSTQAALLPAQH